MPYTFLALQYLVFLNNLRSKFFCFVAKFSEEASQNNVGSRVASTFFGSCLGKINFLKIIAKLFENAAISRQGISVLLSVALNSVPHNKYRSVVRVIYRSALKREYFLTGVHLRVARNDTLTDFPSSSRLPALN